MLKLFAGNIRNGRDAKCSISSLWSEWSVTGDSKETVTKAKGKIYRYRKLYVYHQHPKEHPDKPE
ncbi:MAG: hypothetical protein QXH24_02690 [Candidatus Bathyarchaeia archaeon]